MADERRGKPTIYDVAKRVGVSTATVSRALNGTGQIAPATRALIDDAVRELGYQPNGLARGLRTKSTQTIALLVPDITNPFYPHLVSGVQALVRRRGYTMLLASAEGDAAGEMEYLELFRAKGVDGALVIGMSVPKEQIAQTVADGFPIVSLDRDIDSPDVPLVRLDNRGGARQATDHLIGLGHRAIAHVAGPQRLALSRERLAGYTGALKTAGVAYDDRLVTESDFTEQGGYDSARALLASGVGFSAVFCGNDLMAVGAMNALIESGHAVPGDVSVIGFDDLPLATYTTPRLTTMHQPAVELGEKAAALLIDVIKGRRRAAKAGDVVLSARLVERASTGPPPAARRKRR